MPATRRGADRLILQVSEKIGPVVLPRRRKVGLDRDGRLRMDRVPDSDVGVSIRRRPNGRTSIMSGTFPSQLAARIKSNALHGN
jgi:hypothetical protein